MKKKQLSVGFRYYKKAGLTKSVVVHMEPKVYDRLVELAAKDQRSIQMTARRILEERLKTA